MTTLTATDMAPFWAQVSIREDDTCWSWNGGTSNQYGYWTPPVATGLGRTTAHRFAYMDMVGEIPVGLHLDHLCRNKLCVNPDHLDPVTPQENVRRACAWTTAQQRRAAAEAMCEEVACLWGGAA